MAKKTMLTAKEAEKIETLLANAKRLNDIGDSVYLTPQMLKLIEKSLTIAKESGAVAEKDAKPSEESAPAKPDVPKNLDEFHYPILSKDGIRRIAESLIPQKFRPYYVGCEIEKAYLHPNPWTADNSEIYLYFKSPVVGLLSDARYVHCNLDQLIDDLGNLELDESSKGDADYEEYDAEYDSKPVVKIPDGKPILDGWRKVEFVKGFEIPLK